MSIQTKQAIIVPGEILLFTKWAEQATDAEILARVRHFITLSNDPFLEETHCGGIQDFESIEDFIAAKP
jgi:hypothetical protein